MDAATSIAAGSKALIVKAIAFMATPAFGVLALAGVVGWQYLAAKQDEKEMKLKAQA